MTGWIWVGFVAASALGAVLRFLLDSVIGERTVSKFPWGTFAINVTGSLVLGAVTGFGVYHAFPEGARLALGTGFCGGFTTFSTFTFETVMLIEEGHTGDALRSAAGGLGAGLAAAALGLLVAAAL